MERTKDYVFQILDRTAEGIALTFGPSCETLIHDMSVPGHPIAAIYNGHVSGRQVGSTADIFGDDLHAAGAHFKPETDAVNCLVITNAGRYVKSTTINYVGKGYHYALGINFDCTAFNGAVSALENFIQINGNLQDALGDSANTQLEEIFAECLALVGKPISVMKKNDRLRLVALLLQRNAFTFQRSISYVAEQLGVSRYTVYKYCHEIEENSSLQV